MNLGGFDSGKSEGVLQEFIQRWYVVVGLEIGSLMRKYSTGKCQPSPASKSSFLKELYFSLSSVQNFIM